MSTQQTILVVDDSSPNLSLLNSMLKDRYRVRIATNGEDALRLAQAEETPDLILLDIVMPGMDGYEVCQRLKQDERTLAIPVIFLTAKSDVDDETRGFAIGAVDYIHKPFCPPVVWARVHTHLRLKEANEFLHQQNQLLEQRVQERTEALQRQTEELGQIKDATIFALASLAETRDNETGNHIRRTQNYVRVLAENLRDNPRFHDFLTDENIDLLYKSAPLHDIGKVGIPDYILLKPGKLSTEEFEIMKTHTTLGRDAILQAEQHLGAADSSFLRFAREIAYSHQEKWDGSGYPLGLVGDEIPISARLMAVADVYDALINRRVYKEAFSHDYAVDTICAGRGRHFDPDIVDVFLHMQRDFFAIAQRYVD